MIKTDADFSRPRIPSVCSRDRPLFFPLVCQSGSGGLKRISDIKCTGGKNRVNKREGDKRECT